MSRQLIDMLTRAKRELDHCSPLAMPAYVRQLAELVSALVIDHENRIEAIERRLEAIERAKPPIL
jgi:hypothetical protein